MPRDIKEHDTLSCTDDYVRQNKIKNARVHIYDSAFGVTSTVVEELLKDESLVPTLVSSSYSNLAWLLKCGYSLKNAFSDKLSGLGFSLFCMLVVDLMHEFELGVWKALFTHLIRILSAATVGDTLVNELDRRY